MFETADFKAIRNGFLNEEVPCLLLELKIGNQHQYSEISNFLPHSLSNIRIQSRQLTTVFPSETDLM